MGLRRRKGFYRQRGRGKGEIIISKECTVLGQLPPPPRDFPGSSGQVASATSLDIKSWVADGRLLT